MIRVKKTIIRNTAIMLKDENSLENFRGLLAELLDVERTQITFIHEELNGYLEEDDPCLNLIKRLKEEPATKEN